MKIIKEENLKIKNQNFDLNCSILEEIRKSQFNKVFSILEKVEGLKCIQSVGQADLNRNEGLLTDNHKRGITGTHKFIYLKL